MRMRSGSSAPFALLILGMLALMAMVVYSMMGTAQKMAGGPTTAPVAAATRPADAKTVDVPIIVSPEKFAVGPEANITRLIEQHNAWQDQLADVTLHGQCTWNLDMPGTPRDMFINFERASNHATLSCGTDSADVKDGTVTMGPKAAMNVDALYLLVFRKYNAADFRPAPPQADPPAIVTESESVKLLFQRDSGQLMKAVFQTPDGPVTATFSDYKPLTATPHIQIPTHIAVLVPPDLFPFERTRPGEVVLTVDVDKSISRRPKGQ